MDMYSFFQSIYKEECLELIIINSVFETAAASLSVWLVAAFGKLNNSLGCRERQAHNGNVRSLVFTPAILFNGKKIWRAGGMGFVVHGHDVCACDAWE